MDRRASLYRFAEQQGIDVDYFPTHKVGAFSLPVNGTFSIAIDPRKLESTADETVKLAHELGHCQYCGFYDTSSPLDVRGQHEYKANVWAVKKIIPWATLRRAVRSGTTTLYELAELFNVTEEFMSWAITYYTERQGLSFD